MLKKLTLVLDTLAAIAIVSLCILIVANVLSREFLATGVPDSIILVRELMVPAILLPMASATLQRSHVSITFLTDKLSPQANRWLAVFGVLFGLVIALVLLFVGWQEFWKYFHNGARYTGEFTLLKWPSRAAFLIAMAVFVVSLLRILAIDLRAALTGTPAPLFNDDDGA